MRLGLCCTFVDQPIRFRQTTATAQSRLERNARERKLRELVAHNVDALRQAIHFCASNGIGDFRINSQILPLRTHPQLGYDASALGEDLVQAFRACGQYAQKNSIRLGFHPDQFVVLSSPHEAIVRSGLAEIEHQAEVAEWLGADVINIHGGGVYGDKQAALQRLAQNIQRLSPRARSRLTLENDDRCYTPSDLLPICEATGVPLVYDVHHHRCHRDGLDVVTATELALATWDREPMLHLSSPRDGWRARDPRPHSDFIALRDFPVSWQDRDVTVEIEAKAKDRAVLRLQRALKRRETRKVA